MVPDCSKCEQNCQFDDCTEDGGFAMTRMERHIRPVGGSGAVLVRLATVQPFVAYLKARNVDPEPSLHKFGLTSKDVRNPERLLHPDAIYGIVNDLAEAIEDPFFGVHVGEDIDFESWPIWSSYYGPSSNLFATFTQMIQSAAPLSNSVVHRLEVGSTVSAYRVHRQIQMGNAPAHVDGFALASKLRFFDRLDGEAWDPARVTFETGFPEAVPRDYRGVNIELSDPGSCHLHFPTAWLLRPFLGSACRHDQENHSYEPPSLISAIGLVAPDLLAGESEDLRDAIAGRLGLSVADMLAALRSSETTFAREIRMLRLRLAHQALAATDEPVTDIALRLGFAETASFTRFFKSHTGNTPSAFRKRT